MKKVLYITNIKVPYRVRFFDGLSKHCDLTVLYEREQTANRNKAWTDSENVNFHVEYLNGFKTGWMKTGKESAFSLNILKYILSGYDDIIIGCYNSPIQILAMLAMRLFHIPFYINLDGEAFLEGRDIKTRVKRLFLKGASGFFVAGEKAAESLKRTIGNAAVTVYYFSSLGEQEIQNNTETNVPRNDEILIVGQCHEHKGIDVKGLDVMATIARRERNRHYKFIGMGDNAKVFAEKHGLLGLDHVEIIPFLQKPDLVKEYQKCKMMVLPSRQECWGLVINEAASFGTPIVSTWGSGAAVEFLADRYPHYLAKPGDVDSLLAAIQRLEQTEDRESYGQYLKEKAFLYSIEKSVERHAEALEAEGKM